MYGNFAILTAKALFSKSPDEIGTVSTKGWLIEKVGHKSMIIRFVNFFSSHGSTWLISDRFPDHGPFSTTYPLICHFLKFVDFNHTFINHVYSFLELFSWQVVFFHKLDQGLQK